MSGTSGAAGCSRREPVHALPHHLADHLGKVGTHAGQSPRALDLEGVAAGAHIGVNADRVPGLVLAACDDTHDGRLDALEDVTVLARRRVPLRDDVQQDLAVRERAVHVEEVGRREPGAIDEGEP